MLAFIRLAFLRALRRPPNPLLAGLLVSALLAATAHAGINTWTSNGPGGGCILSVTVDPTTPSTLYAVTNSYSDRGCGPGLFKSTDTGASWNASNTGLPEGAVASLAIDPSASSTLYALAGADVFKSTDGGGSWNASNAGLVGTPVGAVVIDPSVPTTLYAGTDMGVFKSLDGGARWSSTALTRAVGSLVNDPGTPPTLYALTYPQFNSHLFKSTDGGDSWQPLPSPGQISGLSQVAIAPGSPLYGLGDGYAFKSIDGVTGWIVLNTGPLRITGLAIDPVTLSTLYALQTDSSLIRSTDGGTTWHPLETGLLDTQVLVPDPTSAGTLYAGSALDGLLRSTDGGASWCARNSGLPTVNVISALAADPRTAGIVYAVARSAPSTLDGTTPTHFWRSADGDGCWRPSNTGFSGTDIAAVTIAADTPGTLYAGTTAGRVFKSTDGGVHWNEIGTYPGPGVAALAVDPDAAQVVYAGTNGGGVLKSTDAGASWSAMNTGLPMTLGEGISVQSLAIDALTPRRLYAVTAGSAVFASADGAASWDALVDNVKTLALDPLTPTTLYALNPGGDLFGSTDGGTSWFATGPRFIPTISLAVDPLTPNILYVGTQALGVARSTDSGTTFLALPPTLQLAGQPVTALAIDPSEPTIVYAATSTASVFSIQQIGPCRGDCSGAGGVTVDELVTGVNIALGTQAIAQCPEFDGNGDGHVTVDELLAAVHNSLKGCGEAAAQQAVVAPWL